MPHVGGGGCQKGPKSVTYYVNGPSETREKKQQDDDDANKQTNQLTLREKPHQIPLGRENLLNDLMKQDYRII